MSSALNNRLWETIMFSAWTPSYTVGGIGDCLETSNPVFFSDEDLFYEYGPITAVRGWTDYYLSG